MMILTELKTARGSARAKLRSKVATLQAALTGEAAINPTSLKRKATQVDQFWAAFNAAHEAYMVKLNPEDVELETEMEYLKAEDTATEVVLAQAQAQLQIANAPAPAVDQVPDNSGKIKDLKAELVEKKNIAEKEFSHAECLTIETESKIQY